MAVIGFEMEASEYIVCSVARMRFSRSAQPKASSHTIWPSRATATATDGVLVSMSFFSMLERTSSNWAAAVFASTTTNTARLVGKMLIVARCMFSLPFVEAG